MEEEIIERNRNPDIKFQSGFGGDATLQSLESAGLITGDQADRIEMGELDQHELDLQLKPWLFCGEEPIVGIILEETGEKISICEAGQRNLLRKGTTLELLEAQAAVGFIVEPKTGEKLSVEEAIQRRLVDNYQVRLSYFSDRFYRFLAFFHRNRGKMSANRYRSALILALFSL